MAVEVGKKYSLGEFELEPDKYLLKHGGETIHLPELPFRVLLYLVENRERYVSRQELLERFWAGSDGYEETLTKCISTIRTQLNDPPAAPRCIGTRKKVGYRYIGPVEEQSLAPRGTSFEVERTRGIKIVVQEDGEHKPVFLKGEDAAESSTTIPSALLHGRIIRRSRWPVIVILSSAVIVIAVLAFVSHRIRAHANTSAAASIRSVAVLPLKNLSGDPTNEYFSDGLTESLISALSKIENLKVISRSSVFRFKNQNVTPQELGNSLGVAAVLEGGVRNIGNSVRIDLRLVSVDNGQVLWANDEHDHALADLFALQDEIARNVAAALRLRLSGETERTLARRYTDDIEAYRLYLQGRFYWNNYSAHQDLLKAIQYFQAATARDPNYALAYSGLADSYISLGMEFQNPKEVMPKALECADRALALDDQLGEAHYSRGAVAYFYEWNWELAQKELDRSFELNAKSLEANACYLHQIGASRQPDEGLTIVRRALDQNPLSTYIEGELSCASYYAHLYDQAIDFSNETLRTDHSYMFPHYNLARALGQKQMYEQAQAELNKAMEIAGRTPMIVSELGYDYAASGRKEEALKLLNELQTRSRREFIDPYPLAFIYVGLGDYDQALLSLEKAYDIRSTWMPWIKVEPKFEVLHSDSRFTALLKRLNLDTKS